MPEYYFNLPPFEELNPTQQTAVLDESAIALSGGPGTGKSVVSLWRHILNHQRAIPVLSQLLTYTTSLALYLKKCCKTQNENASEYVDSSKHWIFNHPSHKLEILHDEAQDLPIQFNINLKIYTNKLSYGADDRQLITSQSRNPDGTYNLQNCSPEEELKKVFLNNSFHELARNYRNSKKILRLAKRLFSHFPKGPSIPQELIDSCKIEGEFPRLLISGHNTLKIDQAVIQLIDDFAINETTNIGIIVPFETQNHIASETATAQYYYNLLRNKRPEKDCSIYTNSMGGATEIKNIHVTTFKSAKGLEFDVVILPDFNFYNTKFMVVDWRDFYVGVTRTKSNLFLLSRIDLPDIPSDGINKLIDKVVL